MTAVHGYTSAIGCGFCGRTKTEYMQIIAGPGVYICDRCLLSADNPCRRVGTCAFCAEAGDVALSAAGGEAICPACVAISRGLLAT